MPACWHILPDQFGYPLAVKLRFEHHLDFFGNLGKQLFGMFDFPLFAFSQIFRPVSPFGFNHKVQNLAAFGFHDIGKVGRIRAAVSNRDFDGVSRYFGKYDYAFNLVVGDIFMFYIRIVENLAEEIVEAAAVLRIFKSAQICFFTARGLPSLLVNLVGWILLPTSR